MKTTIIVKNSSFEILYENELEGDVFIQVGDVFVITVGDKDFSCRAVQIIHHCVEIVSFHRVEKSVICVKE